MMINKIKVIVFEDKIYTLQIYSSHIITRHNSERFLFMNLEHAIII